MATLVLTAVGTAIGGPIGGAVGALIGQGVDARIFRPGAREGARLRDLEVQTSRYGAQIPRLYGTLRAAGTVIWSTDLQESSEISGGGKGQPNVTSYSYSASFAVALSSRRVAGIGRIWADGNLLRGAAGDFKAPLGAFRLHDGGEDQPADPLIAAAVGIDQAPAYRGCAYAVFEDLQLADFGNRIPSLTFELVADPDAMAVSAILSDLADCAIPFLGDGDEPSLDGFAGEGDDLRGASEALIAAHGLRWCEQAGRLALTAGTLTETMLDPARALRARDGEPEAAPTKGRAPIETVPVRLSIRHHDPARDYQIGIQTAERPQPETDVVEIDYPAVLSAEAARQLADQSLRRALRQRMSVRWSAGWPALALGIGDIVSIAGEPGAWIVEARDWEDMAVRLTLRAHRLAGRPAGVAGDPGQPVVETDLPQGPTYLAIVEWPPDGTMLSTAPDVRVAATGDDAGWRRAALFRFREGTEAAEPVGRTAPRATIGRAETILADGAPWRLDRRNSVEVRLDNVADALTSVTDEQLFDGANLAMLGDEFFQFGLAEPVGPRRYRLSRLVRGWHGTEWACASHVLGERFVLVDAARLARVETGAGDIGTMLDIRAIGTGDAMPAEAARLVDGRAMVPPAPVHGRVSLLPNGDLALRWIRRSRLGWSWPDGGEVPLGEEGEHYLLSVMAGDVVLRAWEATTTTSLYAAADHAADLAAAGMAALTLQIRQSGTFGPSWPLILTVA